MDLPGRIDIYVPDEVAKLIHDDGMLFEFFKDDSMTLNQNEFLTELICGYYSTYVEETNRYLTDLQKRISQYVHDADEEKKLADKILNEIVFPEYTSKGRKNVSCLRLKSTKKLQGLFNAVSYDVLADASVSKYFRNILISYSKKPLSQREKIIFADTYNAMLDACKHNRHMDIVLSFSSGKVHHVIPYCVVSGYEDMFNYLLCEEINSEDGSSKAKTFRINRISSFSRSKDSGAVSPKAKENLERMLHLSPQYAFNDDKPICVRMNPSGKDLFRKIYHHRPTPVEVKKEGDQFRFYFNCSIAQASLYFRKFEQDTIEILEPVELKEDLTRFYQKAVIPLHLSMQESEKQESKGKPDDGRDIVS